MKRLVIALIGAVVIIGIETYLLLKTVPPISAPASPKVVVVVTPPPSVGAAQPRQRSKRKLVSNASSQRPHEAPNLGQMLTGESRPFVMPTGGIFSGVDPQDPRIYHFNRE